VLDLIEALQAEFAFALVVATHDVDVAARFDRMLELEDGVVVRSCGACRDDLAHSDKIGRSGCGA